MDIKKANTTIAWLIIADFLLLIAGVISFVIWLWVKFPVEIWKAEASFFLIILSIAVLIEFFKDEPVEKTTYD